MRYYTTGELAAAVGVTRKTVWTWCRYGCPVRGIIIKLESEQWGKHYRISQEQWDAFHAAINNKPLPTPPVDNLAKRDAAARARLRAMGMKNA